MKYLSLSNGDQIPMLGLGTWKSTPGEIHKAVRSAIEVGYRHFDCAFIYQNEKEVGLALNDAINAGDVNREELWITSKLWNSDHQNVKAGFENTLTDFGLDYLDLYLIHWPVALKKGCAFPQKASDYVSLSEAPLIETWKNMELLHQLGVVKHIGVANFSIKKLELLKQNASHLPEVNQVERHVLLQQKSLSDYCQKENIIVTAYSPFGSPDRHPSMKSGDEPNMFELSEIKEIAKRNNCTPAQVLLAFHIKTGVTVIPKSVNIDRMKQNLEAVDINLSPNDLQQILSLDQHYRYIKGQFWNAPEAGYTLENLWDE